MPSFAFTLTNGQTIVGEVLDHNGTPAGVQAYLHVLSDVSFVKVVVDAGEPNSRGEMALVRPGHVLALNKSHIVCVDVPAE